MAISAHKLYGPKGVGALYVRHNHDLPKPLAQIHGGGHEKGMRSGTLNVPGIAGFGKAAELRLEEMILESDRLENLRNKLEKGLLELSDTFFEWKSGISFASCDQYCLWWNGRRGAFEKK